MSQTYVIKVSASVQEHVRAKDKRVKKIVLTEIVSKEEQKELVRGQLVERGFEQEGADPDVLVRRKGEVVERVDLGEMTHEATVEKDKVLERERTVVVRGDRDLEDQEERRRREQRGLEQQIAITEEERAKAQSGLQRAPPR